MTVMGSMNMYARTVLLIEAFLVFGITTPALAQADKEGYRVVVSDELRVRRLTDDGGRLDWYKGDKHELIAFDAVVNQRNRNTEVFVMRPDGSGRRCVTCDAATPNGFVGQPAWHPDGEHIVIQVENSNSRHRLWEHIAWGINNDLWVVRRDGSGAELIFESPKNHAVLHPHFNADGSKIIFAERVPTGRKRPRLRRITPGGENPWEGWRIHIADFDIAKTGTARLLNHRILYDDESGLFETHGFTHDGRIVFSHTRGGRAYMDDIYIANDDGSRRRKLIDSTRTWDEHGRFSPSGKTLAFVSSRDYWDWRAPRSTAKTLRLDLYSQDRAGKVRRLTDANANAREDMRYIVSDFDWDASGTRIAFQLAPFDDRVRRPGSPQIWVLTFPRPQ